MEGTTIKQEIGLKKYTDPFALTDSQNLAVASR
jgi:hypothetical protein